MRKLILLLSMVIASNVTFAQFDGAVGTPGCQAIGISNPSIVSWAKGVEVKRGFQGTSSTNYAAYGKSYMAQGIPDSTTTRAISLGRNGEAIITFDRPIINGTGYDFAVFENGFSSTYLELAFVEVSSDGIHYFRFPSTSNSTSEGNINPTLINNLAGKYEVGYGTPFNLDDISDDANLDKSNIRFVKLVDVNGGVDMDAQGNIIYDASSGGPATGFDLTGVCVLNGGSPYIISNFEGMLTQTNTYEIINSTNGIVDNDGNYHRYYTNNGVVFEALGLYGGSFACGFGLSNLTGNSTTTSFYESAANMGLEGPDSVYLNAYYSDYAGTIEHNIVKMADSSLFKPMGVYVDNSLSTYNYNTTNSLSNYWLTINAYGYDANGNITDSSSVYLADKRNGANINVKDWTWLDLSNLGQCSKVIFKLGTNDDSGYGMNPPAYFCLDNFVIESNVVIPEIPMNVTTLAASNIGFDSASLNGSIDLGNQTIINKGFQWRLNTESTWNDVIVSGNDFSYTLTNLIADTTYIYRAFATSANDTVYGSEINFTTLNNSGLENINSNNISMTLYPNPTSGLFNINIEGINSDVMIFVCDAQGRIVNSKSFNTNNNIINFDLSSYPKGVYFIKVITNKSTLSQKLIVF
ncbi:MAG: aggregation factor core protein MAFp3, isoform [Bacteroidetes bacterium]|nr:aggregation factor core protein MAFp3, isoform [Bacteroidota bacterium]